MCGTENLRLLTQKVCSKVAGASVWTVSVPSNRWCFTIRVLYLSCLSRGVEWDLHADKIFPAHCCVKLTAVTFLKVRHRIKPPLKSVKKERFILGTQQVIFKATPPLHFKYSITLDIFLRRFPFCSVGDVLNQTLPFFNSIDIIIVDRLICYFHSAKWFPHVPIKLDT